MSPGGRIPAHSSRAVKHVLPVTHTRGMVLGGDFEASLVPVDALRAVLLRRKALLLRGFYRAEPAHSAVNKNWQASASHAVFPRLRLRAVH